LYGSNKSGPIHRSTASKKLMTFGRDPAWHKCWIITIRWYVSPLVWANCWIFNECGRYHIHNSWSWLPEVNNKFEFFPGLWIVNCSKDLPFWPTDKVFMDRSLDSIGSCSLDADADSTDKSGITSIRMSATCD